MHPVRVLLLGGTAEARRLAGELAGRPEYDVVGSLAGRVAAPASAPVPTRIGGFGGVDGLAAWLEAERIDVVVDATHPFAARITRSAVVAARRTGVPLLVLRRPGWAEGPGDDWRRVPSLEEAARRLPGDRVFLATGRMGLAAFAHDHERWYLVRSVEPPAPPMPPRAQVVLGRGPFTVDGEVALMREHRIDVLVTKDSGGEATAAKLVAARRLRVPVVMVDRPPAPDAATVTSTDEALTWLFRLTAD
ncbi:precorrin-6A reductase [Actinomadura sp. NBRC 104412]|nr:precorrin-6A reductase [Actinomadura sp. NBRC 104412]